MNDKSYTIRVPKRWVRIAMIVGVTALVVAPLTAVATHTFTDVPNSHTFHNDITWLAEADVTRGCNPPANSRYCPDDLVTRGQMAAFIKRLAENRVVDAGSLDGKPATAFETRVAADGCRVNSTATATSCTNNPDGSIPDNTTVELARVTLNAPSSGTLVLSGHRVGTTITWFALNESCAAWASPPLAIINQSVNNTLFGYDSIAGSATTAVNVSAGNQTVRLCGLNDEPDGAGNVTAASLTAMWTAGGSVSVSAAAEGEGAAPLGGADSLLGG